MQKIYQSEASLLHTYSSSQEILNIDIEHTFISTMTTDFLSASQAKDFDYVIVGGGTAGCVIASRLSEYLPSKKILLIEAGPSDYNNEKVLQLKEWLTLLGGDLDYDYGTVEQPNGRPSCPNSSYYFLTGFQAIHTSGIPELRFLEAALRTTP